MAVCLGWLPAALSFHTVAEQTAVLTWDESTLTLIQPDGVYGRMVRLADHSILCSYEWHGRVYVRRSSDDGKHWQDAVMVAALPFALSANPEMLVLHDGSVLLSYNERPLLRSRPFTIRISFSRDNGATWTESKTVYQAGNTADTGCWEPAQVQLPWGEIRLYFANEKPYTATAEQEISIIRSFDGGATWSDAVRASFRPGHRDGMPVPLILNGAADVILAIEDNGLQGTFKPAVVAHEGGLGRETLADDAGAPRWGALQPPLPPSVYAGAPYLRQFPSGETVLSIQSGQGRIQTGTLNFSRMVVYIGDSQARNFTRPSEPFAVAPNANGLWNALFIKNASVVTALSTTTIGGIRGLWAIDGRLEQSIHDNEAGAEGERHTRAGQRGNVTSTGSRHQPR